MQNIHIIARGVCIKDDRILLAHFDKKAYYFLPGGHVEAAESAEDALVRELREETGLAITVKEFLGVFEHAWGDSESGQHEMNLIFSYDVASEAKVNSQVEHLSFEWVPLLELAGRKFLPKELVSSLLELPKGMTFPRFLSSIKQSS